MQGKTPGSSCFALFDVGFDGRQCRTYRARRSSAQRASAGKTGGTPSPLQPAAPGDAVEIAAPSGKPLFNRLIRLVYNILRFSLDRHNRLTYLSDPMEM